MAAGLNLPWASPSGRRDPGRGRYLAGLLVALLMSAQLVSLVGWWHVPYYVLSPGPTASVTGLVTVDPAHHHPVKGQVLLTTVYESRARVIDFLLSWAHSDSVLTSTQDIAGNLTPAELQQLNQAEMTLSENQAKVAALRRAGYSVPEHGTGAQVVAVLANTAATGRLNAGDTIIAVNGRPTNLEQDVAAALAAVKPGQSVALTVQDRSRVQRQVIATLGPRPGAPSLGFLGVELATRDDRFDFPFPVSINAEGIGGPSAGLAFTLGILDELTSGNLTGGHNVAATGTIDFDGTVGDVGGVAQKTVSVSRSGATLFLVPPGEYATARAHAGPNLKVVQVSTLNQALAAIAQNGGSLAGLPPSPAGIK